MCSICWSQLDFDWGKRKARGHVYRHPQITSESGGYWTDKTGECWLVWDETNRCINPECDAAVFYRYLPSKLSFSSPYHPEDVKTFKIRSVRYKRGEHGEDGVFRLRGKTVKLKADTRGVECEVEFPWVYINPGDFYKEIPDAWTITDQGWIKANAKSVRFQKIRKWFGDRRIRIDDVKEEDQ